MSAVVAEHEHDDHHDHGPAEGVYKMDYYH